MYIEYQSIGWTDLFVVREEKSGDHHCYEGSSSVDDERLYKMLRSDQSDPFIERPTSPSLEPRSQHASKYINCHYSDSECINDLVQERNSLAALQAPKNNKSEVRCR